MTDNKEKLYIIVTHYHKVDNKNKPFVHEEVRISSKFKKRYLDSANIIIDVTNLKMVKDRYDTHDPNINEFEVALGYIEQLSQRNNDVKKIWESFVNHAKEKAGNELVEDKISNDTQQ